MIRGSCVRNHLGEGPRTIHEIVSKIAVAIAIWGNGALRARRGPHPLARKPTRPRCFPEPLPRPVAVNPVTIKIYVANETAGSVTVIDGATKSGSVLAGSSPDAVAVNPVTEQDLCRDTRQRQRDR